jgi:hypothetical protein
MDFRLCDECLKVGNYVARKEILPDTALQKWFEVEVDVPTAVVMKNSIFWNITPCRLLKVNRCFGVTFRLHLQGRRTSQIRNQHKAESKQIFILVSFLASSSTLNIEVTRSFETLVDFQHSTWRYIPEDIIIQFIDILTISINFKTQDRQWFLYL